MFRRCLLLLLITSLAVCVAPGGGSCCYAQDDPASAGDEDLVSPLAQEPETAEEHFDAVLLMLRLSRPRLAARYLDAFMQLDPDEDTLLALRKEHGTGTFLQLTRIEELQPIADELLDRLTKAALARIHDPAYVDDVMAKLAGSPREQAQAINELKHLGPSGVIPLLQRMSAQDAGVDRDLLLFTLVQLGEPAVAPLLGAVRTADDLVRSDAIKVLGFLGARETVLPHLWRPAFEDGGSDAVRTSARRAIARILHGDADRVARIPSFGIADKVERAAREHFRGDVVWEVGEDERVGVWTWDPALGTVQEFRVTPTSASLFVGQQLARDLLALSPRSEEAQALFLAVALAHDRHRAGWDKPAPEGPGTAHDLALVAGADAVERVLGLALEEDNVAAAEAALRVLGQNGTRHLLTRTAGERPLLLRALDAPHARVQFAAASTIMQLDPDGPFRGADRVVEIFARALNGTAQPRTVVIDPNVDRASYVASLVRGLGYEAEIATTGMDGFRQVAAHGDTELAVLHLNTIRWELSQTVANLRADSRTANVPIAIYGPSGLQGRVQHLMRDYQPAVYLEEANSSSDIARKLRPFLALVSPPPMTDSQRAERIAAAAFWLRHIAQGQRTKIFNLRPAEDALSSAVGNEAVARDALIALGAIGTTTAQERLVDSALAPGFPLDVRETAALQLAFHIQRYGSLVRNGQLADLKRAWETATEPELKTALSSVIGSLGPQREAVSRQLQDFQGGMAPVE